jgi:alpha-glucoside transport system substrate-binding protein
MRRRRAERFAGLLVAAAVVLGACSSDSETSRALSVFGPWRGEEAASFRAVLDHFEAESGIEVRYTGTASFPSAIVDRVEESDPPDVAVFPQPALLQDLVSRGYVLPLRSDISELARANYVAPIADVDTETGGLDGVLVRLNVKSLVWYRPDIFGMLGYDVPGTWEELSALADRMIEDGYGPWCLGLASFDADGWPATDWVEDIVLRFSGAEVYDDWVEGLVPFTDGEIAAAFEEFDRTALASVEPIGGRRSIVNTTVSRAQDPMFELRPRCLMYRQASFQVDNLPSGLTVGPGGDVDVFVLPGLEATEPAPLLVGGDFAAALSEREEAFELLRFLASPEAGTAWANRGDFVSPFSGFDPSEYRDQFDSRMAGLLGEASVVRFDGSDLMYPPVGTGTFRDAMILYAATSRLSDALQLAQSGYDE